MPSYPYAKIQTISGGIPGERLRANRQKDGGYFIEP